MYKVIKFFTDLEDHGHAYNVGDEFPRKGREVSAERLAKLAGSNNRQRVPLIKKVAEESQKDLNSAIPAQPEKAVQVSPPQEPVTEQKPKPKRSRKAPSNKKTEE